MAVPRVLASSSCLPPQDFPGDTIAYRRMNSKISVGRGGLCNNQKNVMIDSCGASRGVTSRTDTPLIRHTLSRLTVSSDVRFDMSGTRYDSTQSSMSKPVSLYMNVANRAGCMVGRSSRQSRSLGARNELIACAGLGAVKLDGQPFRPEVLGSGVIANERSGGLPSVFPGTAARRTCTRLFASDYQWA
jgi:hypothetical protein